MAKASFGKTMENFRKRSKVKFVSNPQQDQAFTQRATFKSFQIIRQDLVCVSFKNSSVVWTKRTRVGASILGLSKLTLYKFHYEEMVPHYPSIQLKVAYKDTDPPLYLIETPGLCNDTATFKHLLDLSDYPQEHFLHDPTNKKVPLTMTDELQGKVLRETVCLRSNLYSIDYVGGKKQSAKGVEKSVKKTLNHDLFRNCLFSKKEVIKTMTQLRSHCNQIVVNDIDKVAISSFDEKRFLLENGVSSLAYGHYKISTLVDEATDQSSGLFFCSTKFNSQLVFLPPTGFENLYSVLVLDFLTTNDSLPLNSGSCTTASFSSLASTNLASSSPSESDSTTEPRGFLQRIASLSSSSKFLVH